MIRTPGVIRRHEGPEWHPLTPSGAALHPPPMRHIGIAAHSADGSSLCYLEMVRESARRLGEHEHPEITLSILPMGPTIPLWDANDLSQINTHLRHTADPLKA